MELQKSNRILRLPEVMVRLSLWRSTLYAWIIKGKFPKQGLLGSRCVGWLEYEVDEWLQKKIDKR